MKIIEIETKKVLYESEGGDEYFVTSSFFNALKGGKISHWSGGGKIKETIYDEISTLDIKDKEFDSIFQAITKSEVGKAAMKGKLPLNTTL